MLRILMVFIFVFSGNVWAEGFNKNWLGTWTREYASRFDISRMEIFYNTENSFLFKINASYGANTGSVSGIALIKDNFAIFYDDEDGMIEFIHENNKILLKPNIRMPKYAGMGVEFDGIFIGI